MSSQMSSQLNPNYKTSICKYAFIGCKQKQNCWYAHNKDELRQRYCINNNCTNTNCIYLHSNTNIDKDVYFLKVLQKSDVLGIDKNMLNSQIDMLSCKFIIEIENDMYDDNTNDTNDKDVADVIVNSNVDDKYKDEDYQLQQYISDFTQQWQQDPKQFYQLADNKHKLTLTMKVDDVQMQMITHILQSMKIEFNIDQFNRKEQ
jgi:hypothetical protein